MEERDQPLATTLADRGEVRPRARVGANGFVGAYTLVRELARAPGAWLHEGKNGDEQPVLIQIAGLKAAPSEAERIERSHYEHALTSATKALLDDPACEIVSHGAADEIGGRRILFWVLNWPAKFGASLGSWLDLAAVALAIARRIDQRHKLGSCLPQLSEHSILVAADRTQSKVLGAPIFISSEWLCHRTIPTRFAPEEAISRRPSALGDLWRLGQALRTMGATFDDLPAPFEALLEKLEAIDPKKRPSRASEVIVELENLLAQDLPVVSSNTTVSFGALAPERFEALLVESSGDSTRVEPVTPIFELIEHDRTREVVTLIPPQEISPTVVIRSVTPIIEPVSPPPVSAAPISTPREESPEERWFQEPQAQQEETAPPRTYYWMTLAAGFVSGVLAWILLGAV